MGEEDEAKAAEAALETKASKEAKKKKAQTQGDGLTSEPSDIIVMGGDAKIFVTSYFDSFKSRVLRQSNRAFSARGAGDDKPAAAAPSGGGGGAKGKKMVMYDIVWQKEN